MRLSPLTHEDAARLNAVLGSAPALTEGEILKFEGAVLARAEVNKNADGIDATGLRELAQTLPLMPLDDEHVSDRVIGFFMGASVVDDVLLTEGIIYAARFPDVTRDITEGRKHLSIEAYGATARCSMCGEIFASQRDYCTHLAGRPSSGAVRWLSGLRAIGGGAVRRNAGTDTTFDRNGFVLLASLAANDESPIVAADDMQNAAGSVPGGCNIEIETESPQDDEELEGVVAMDELQKTLAEVQALLAQREQELQAAQTRVQELTAAHQDELAAQRRMFERKAEMLAAGFAVDAVNALEAKLATVDTDVFSLLLDAGRRTVTAEVVESNSIAASEPVPVIGQPHTEHAVMASTRIEKDATNPFAIFGK